MMTTTIQDRYSPLLGDPAALRTAWADLLQQHHHLHGPDAARRLGVPEAALLASRLNGHGAIELQPDLTTLLAPSASWGKLLLAARNRMGVGLIIMDDAAVNVDGDQVCFRTHQQEARVTSLGISKCFLFEEHDAHGHTVSINWFDAQGDAVGRLFLMSKSGREAAQPWLNSQVKAHTSPLWAPGSGDAVPHVQVTPTTPIGAACHTLAQHEAAAHLGHAAVLACSRVAAFTVAMQGRGVAVRYQGPLAKTSSTPPAVHAVDAACKLHLRMADATLAQRLQADDGAVTLRLTDSDGGLLDFTPHEPPSNSGDWLKNLEEEVGS